MVVAGRSPGGRKKRPIHNYTKIIDNAYRGKGYFCALATERTAAVESCVAMHDMCV